MLWHTLASFKVVLYVNNPTAIQSCFGKEGLAERWTNCRWRRICFVQANFGLIFVYIYIQFVLTSFMCDLTNKLWIPQQRNKLENCCRQCQSIRITASCQRVFVWFCELNAATPLWCHYCRCFSISFRYIWVHLYMPALHRFLKIALWVRRARQRNIL